MVAEIKSVRKVGARLLAFLSLAWLAACDVALPGAVGDAGARAVAPGAPIQVALLVPGGGSQTDALLARDLENAARLAASELQGAEVEIRVYNTAGDAGRAAAVARQAVADGAQIILGPLYAEAANAVGVAVAPQGVTVLSFSNNTTIAGGNVFVLGPTFENTANRLASYTRGQGISNFFIAHSNDLQGGLGRAAIESAVSSAGGRVVGIEAYALSQEGLLAAGPTIAARSRAAGADAIFTTAGAGDEVAFLASVIADAGGLQGGVPLIGLTRWDAAPQSLATPGLQGGYFALPDQAVQAAFEARYRAAYGSAPHPLAGLAYDGVAMIGALAASGRRDPLSRSALTTGSGFQGTSGVFRLRGDGTNERGLAVARVIDGRVQIVDPAPRGFGGAGF